MKMTLSFEQHDEYKNFKKNIISEKKKKEMSEEELNEWEEWANEWKVGDNIVEKDEEV